MGAGIILGLGVLGGLGLLLGLGLAFSNKWLHVKIAVVRGEAAVTVCVAGGQETTDDVADVMGVEAAEVQKVIARVFCQGGEGKSVTKYVYRGFEDCHAADIVSGGPKACSYACVGFGNCTRVCPYGAILMGEDKLPVVDPELCTGCGLCVTECPKQIIHLIPDDKRVHILCSSRDKGPLVKKVCTVGCIACKLCEKNCPQNAPTVENFLAVMDYSKCGHTCYCVAKCKPKTIVIETRPGEKALEPVEPPKKERKAPAETGQG